MLTSLLRIGCICHDEPQAAGMTHGVDENATDVLMAKAADALTAALDRAEKAEAERVELDALLNEGIATDADTRMQAEARGRVAGLREAAKCYRDGGDWDVFATADCAILDLITEGAQEDI